jgi:predicted anti-sigma-YlaC factor YlaD
MLTCREVTELATDHMEGVLPLRRRVGVRLHLLLCGACRRYLAQMRTVTAALRRLPPAAPRGPVSPRLTAAIREAARGGPSSGEGGERS